MKISRKSWHYRFIHWGWHDPIWWPSTLSIYGYSLMFFFEIIFIPFFILNRASDKFYNWSTKSRPNKHIEFVD